MSSTTPTPVMRSVLWPVHIVIPAGLTCISVSVVNMRWKTVAQCNLQVLWRGVVSPLLYTSRLTGAVESEEHAA